MKRLTVDQLARGDVAIVGVPWDDQSSFLRGARSGPEALRRALASESTNWCTESGRDLSGESRFADVGDIDLPPGVPPEEAVEAIERGVGAVLEAGARVVAIGGDHAVSYALIKAHAAAHGAPTVLHLDAHPDLYDEFQGSRYSHACPFARVMEQGLASRLVQIGIRTATPHQRAQARRFGVETIEMREWPARRLAALEGPVYVSLDLDVIDPSCAPGVSHPEPGGMTTREVIGVIQSMGGHLIGADVVELNPTRDHQGITALVAAKLVKEIVDRLLGREHGAEKS